MGLPLRLQDIPPRWAHFCLDIEKFITEDLNIQIAGSSIVAGLSGGADSTALLAVLHLLSPRLRLSIHPAHLDHGIRPESVSERRQAQERCERLGLRLIHTRRDIPAEAAALGMGLEEAGRKARYEFLEAVRQEHGAGWVALGHQLDDLAEDQLLRLIRGSGWPALGGMSAVCPERRLFRPLLLTPRKELEDFLQSLGLGWTNDASNADPHYRRNRLRHQVLPLLLAENPNYLDNAAGLWRLARLDEEHWDSLGAGISPSRIASSGKVFILASDILINLDCASRMRLYKNTLDRLGRGQALQNTLFQVDEAWKGRRTGKRFQFPGEKVVEVSGEGLIFRAATKDPGVSSVEEC